MENKSQAEETWAEEQSVRRHLHSSTSTPVTPNVWTQGEKQERCSSWRRQNKQSQGSKEQSEEYEDFRPVRKLSEVGRWAQWGVRREGVQECDLMKSSQSNKIWITVILE